MVSSKGSSNGSNEPEPYRYVTTALPVRKNLNQTGAPIKVSVNSFQAIFKPVDPKFMIFQYDVKIFREEEYNSTKDRKEADISRKVKEKIWQSKAVTGALGQYAMYDGESIAWSLEEKDPGKIKVDLTLEATGRPSKKKEGAKGAANIFFAMITFTRRVDFKPLLDVLNGKTSKGAAAVGTADWSMALSMIDHALHQNAKRTSILVKKSVFPKNAATLSGNSLGEAVVAYRGIYLAAKAAFVGFSGPENILRALTINVDATCVAFWTPGNLSQVVGQFLGLRDNRAIEQTFAAEAKNKSDGQWKASRLNRSLMKFKNVRVILKHLQKQGQAEKQEVIRGFLRLPPAAYRFEVENDKGGIPPGDYTVAQYMARKYPDLNVTLGNLPLVDLGRDNYMPMELCEVIPHQKYSHKLSGNQTTKMLALAAELPAKRHASIMNGVQAMGWANDPWLKNFGIRANPQAMIITGGRLLPPPELEFKGNKKLGAKDTRTGNWRIQNLKFVKSNGDARMPITSWACVVFKHARGPAVTQDQAKNFMQSFRSIYASHGGVINCAENAKLCPMGIQNIGDSIAECIDSTTKAFKSKPQIVFFIVPDQSVDVYEAIKKNMDCRHGIASQVLLAKHVVTNKPQYQSNICLKVNAKLGGATTYARSTTPMVKQGGFFNPEERIMVIGSDVTHGAPGSDAKSVASLCMSRDHTLTNYSGAVAINDYRQDIIKRKPMNEIFAPQLKTWMKANGGKLPKRILYFRDGVAREMAKFILDIEVAQIKDCLVNASTGQEGAKLAKAVTFTVVIATKRHHTRIFPEPNRGDKNGNCLPGTLVDTQATGAVDLDWYMISHVALKGTAKPMHYNVVLDENNYKMENLQQFVHECCFQYVRSTTSVSQYPAIYYAHLASKRGVIHEARPLTSQSGGKKEMEADIVAGKSTREALSAHEARKAMDRDLYAENWEMDPVAGPLQDHMWFV